MGGNKFNFWATSIPRVLAQKAKVVNVYVKKKNHFWAGKNLLRHKVMPIKERIIKSALKTEDLTLSKSTI